MMEFLDLCVTPVNLPFTLLLIAVLVYWLLFIFGAVSLDMFDVDFDVDMDMDVEANAEVGAPEGNALVSLLQFFNLGEVPIMILLTFIVSVLWAVTMVTTRYFNQETSALVALAWFVPNLVISLFLTKLLTSPLRGLFRQMKKGIAAPTIIVGNTCIITTGEVTQSAGQAELQQEDGPPIRLNVRAKPGMKLLKGDSARVIAHNENDDTYVVVPADLEMK